MTTEEWQQSRSGIAQERCQLAQTRTSQGWFRFRSIILAGLAVFLVWEVITRSFVATLADLNPQRQ